MYSQDYIAKYEDLLEDMSAWIATQTWGGHERTCPSFAGRTGECNCIESKRVEWHKTHRLREIEHMHAVTADEGDKYTSELMEENAYLKGRVATLSQLVPRAMDLQAQVDILAHELKSARWRIGDMLK
jgi:hypothetical protein